MLTAERLRELLHYDPETGCFTWISKNPRSRYPVGRIAGTEKIVSHSISYTMIGIDRRIYLAHRLAWLYVHGEWPPETIDHINCDGRDNRLANLRLASRHQNQCNSRLFRRNTSGAKGVSYHKNGHKWAAELQVKGRRVRLGLFNCVAEASAARERAAAELHGEFARSA